jgi:hypothetical protein
MLTVERSKPLLTSDLERMRKKQKYHEKLKHDEEYMERARARQRVYRETHPDAGGSYLRMRRAAYEAALLAAGEVPGVFEQMPRSKNTKSVRVVDPTIPDNTAAGQQVDWVTLPGKT